MARTGRAVVLSGKNFELREYPVPDPEPGTVLLRQELGGICGTDLHNWEYQRLDREIILGHENVGIVEALGDGIDSDHLGRPLKEGDRVALAPASKAGAYGFMPVDQEPALRGGFAEYICVYNPGSIYLRTELPPEVAVLSEPFSVGVHGVSRGRPKIGDTVVVQGAGAIGLVTLIAARASGVGQAIVVGGPPGRLRLAEKLGADLTIDIAEVPDPEARKDLVRQATPKGEGADMVFECAGFLPAIPEGLDYLKRGGTYVEMGHFVDTGDFACNPNHMLMRKNLRLEAVWGYREEDFVRGSRILERNEFAFADMVSHMIPLERVAEGFEALHSGYRLDGEDAVKIAVRGGLA